MQYVMQRFNPQQDKLKVCSLGSGDLTATCGRGDRYERIASLTLWAGDYKVLTSAHYLPSK
eukprot:1414329-Amphidinium_carterae.1